MAGDLQARDRFDREARAIAGLNHPHICALYDVGDSPLPSGASSSGSQPPATIRYLVMEYLDGETLAGRLAGGPLPLAEALHVAVQIASALDTAHRAGIVHRDLKPANVMLTKDGAKLLDFGLAKRAIGIELETITSPGMIVGTVQYMAPEQLEGRDAGARTDVFAFGAVLYEMLTGAKAFAGATHASVAAAILDHQPTSLASSVPPVPPALDRVLKRCLAKDPDERWQSTSDLTSELRWIEDTLGQATSKEASSVSTFARHDGGTSSVYWALAVVAALLAGAVASASYFRRAPADAPEMRVQIVLGPGGFGDFALSPDGRMIVFAAGALWLRRLESETAERLPGTDNARQPFWSPGSRSIGFFADGQLKRIDVAGGPPLVLASAPVGLGGTWSAEGVILFTPQNTSPVLRIPAAGGTAVEATRMGPTGITDHWYPHFLPDGRHFLYYAWGTPEQKGVYLGSLDSTDTRRLFDANSTAVFSPPDRVLYARQGALVAQRVDMQTYTLVGDPQTVAGAVTVDNNCGYCAAVSASAAGPIAYRASGAVTQLAWVNRSGQELGTVGAPDAARRSGFRRSPDGRMLAFARDGDYTDIWLLDTISGVTQRFTFDAANKYSPVWSPDGRRIVFGWDPTGDLDLYEKPVDGKGNGTLLLRSSEHKHAQDWSPDGRYILYTSDNPRTGLDLSALPLFGDGKSLEVAHLPFTEFIGRFSPDGRMVAYQSNESGRQEIYVQPFPGPAGKKQITNGGATLTDWGPGRELFYTTSAGLTAVSVTLNGAAIETGTPVVLLTGVYPRTVSPDGQQFLIEKTVKPAPPVTVLLNWKSR